MLVRLLLARLVCALLCCASTMLNVEAVCPIYPSNSPNQIASGYKCMPGACMRALLYCTVDSGSCVPDLPKHLTQSNRISVQTRARSMHACAVFHKFFEKWRKLIIPGHMIK